MLNIVKHKIFGTGEIIGREVKETHTILTVKFKNSGKEMRFALPESFETGILQADGDLKDEVDAAILKRNENKEKKMKEFITAHETSTLARASKRYSKKTPIIATASGSLKDIYEKYLTAAGYCLSTPSGNPSTVFTYSRAVESVLIEEGISWDTLKSNISSIVKKYDIGGQKEYIGCKSNMTVINALKRFQECVDTL